MSKYCINCHFLVGIDRPDEPLSERVIYKPQESHQINNTIIRGDEASIGILTIKRHNLKCARDVWSQSADDVAEDIYRRINEFNWGKNKKCFYYPYNPSMSLETAKILENRNIDEEKVKRGLNYSFWSLTISIFSLLAVILSNGLSIKQFFGWLWSFL